MCLQGKLFIAVPRTQEHIPRSFFYFLKPLWYLYLQDSRKKKKKEKVKPILLNKSEKSIIVDSPVGPMNHFEEILPKDDLLKRKGSVSHQEIPIIFKFRQCLV